MAFVRRQSAGLHCLLLFKSGGRQRVEKPREGGGGDWERHMLAREENQGQLSGKEVTEQHIASCFPPGWLASGVKRTSPLMHCVFSKKSKGNCEAGLGGAWGPPASIARVAEASRAVERPCTERPRPSPEWPSPLSPKSSTVRARALDELFELKLPLNRCSIALENDCPASVQQEGMTTAAL